MKSLLLKSVKVAFASAAVFLSAQAMAASHYAVIVNAENPYSASKAQSMAAVRRIFMREQAMWPQSNLRAKPFGRRGNLHDAFLESVIKKDQAKMDQHWVSVKQLTGETPPQAVRSSRTVVKLVSKYKGAMGFVKRSARLNKKVRVLFTY